MKMQNKIRKKAVANKPWKICHQFSQNEYLALIFSSFKRAFLKENMFPPLVFDTSREPLFLFLSHSVPFRRYHCFHARAIRIFFKGCHFALIAGRIFCNEGRKRALRAPLALSVVSPLSLCGYIQDRCCGTLAPRTAAFPSD